MAVPPLAAYEAWMSTLNGRSTGRGRLTASTFRRMVALRREGNSFAEIARCVGWQHETLRRAWERLPEDLR